MFTTCIILSETEYNLLVGDFIRELRRRFWELSWRERNKLSKSRDIEDWVRVQVRDMFDSVLEDNDAEEAIIFLEGECHYVSDGVDFYNLSYDDFSDVVEEFLEEEDEDDDEEEEELEEDLKGSVKKSMWKRRMV